MPGPLTRFREYLKGRKVSEIIIDSHCPHVTECLHRVVFIYKSKNNKSEARYVEWLYGFEILRTYFHYTTKLQRDHFLARCYNEKEKQDMQVRSPSRYRALFEDEEE